MNLVYLIQIEKQFFNLNLWAILGLNIIFRNNGNRRWRKHLSLPQIMLVQKVLLIVQKGITKRTGIHIGRNISRRTEQKLSIPRLIISLYNWQKCNNFDKEKYKAWPKSKFFFSIFAIDTWHDLLDWFIFTLKWNLHQKISFLA